MFYMYFFLCMIMITSIIYLLNYYLSMIKFMNYSKLIPYECGFSYITNPNLPFSLSFYLINLMFLIFDIEIVMLLPIIFNMNYYNSMIYIFIIFFFMLMLILTMLFELIFNFLNWII
uniref:NADH-ubiquinone oxidoreductase chain 3 n=1 Tax=Eucera floralia TaxID=599063 RepID=A0A343DRI5_9HYME|nr:NADH dehydrogenase subunit 3 [Eucera floralia]